MTRRAYIGALALALVLPALAAAQTIDVGAYGSSLSIDLSPRYPRPGDTVQLTARAVGIDLESSSIMWFADGKLLTQGTGATTATIAAGPAGSTKTIEVDVTTADGSTRAAQATIAPASVDLLISSDSYTPPFYRGRALPSAGSNIIAQAVTRFVRPDGSLIPDSSLTFTWKQEGQALGSLSGRGKAFAVIPIEHLYGGGAITVDVTSDASLAASATAQVPVIDPILDLYEDNSLYGILFNTALPPTSRIMRSQITLAAVPYFMPASGLADRALTYDWTVNGKTISASDSAPSELTLDAANSGGQAAIQLELTRAGNFLLAPRGAWQVTMTDTGSSVPNPFTRTQ